MKKLSPGLQNKFTFLVTFYKLPAKLMYIQLTFEFLHTLACTYVACLNETQGQTGHLGQGDVSPWTAALMTHLC